MTKYQYV